MAAAMALSIYLDQDKKKKLKAAGLSFFLDHEAHKSFFKVMSNAELQCGKVALDRRLAQGVSYGQYVLERRRGSQANYLDRIDSVREETGTWLMARIDYLQEQLNETRA